MDSYDILRLRCKIINYSNQENHKLIFFYYSKKNHFFSFLHKSDYSFNSCKYYVSNNIFEFFLVLIYGIKFYELKFTELIMYHHKKVILLHTFHVLIVCLMLSTKFYLKLYSKSVVFL